MSDWQDFAARPKLEALCEEMESLPARELAPPALAKEVRSLQERWKALGPSRAANELWARFKAAGALTRGGLYDDAQTLYTDLLRYIASDSRKAAIRQELQQIRLLRNAQKQSQSAGL